MFGRKKDDSEKSKISRYQVDSAGIMSHQKMLDEIAARPHHKRLISVVAQTSGPVLFFSENFVEEPVGE